MASYIDQVSSLGPRVWYRFNETAGTPVNFGALTTTATFSNLLLNEQTDVDGRALYFSGSSSYININQWPAFSLFDDKSFTIETWFKLSTQDANNRPIFQFGSFAIDQITLRSVGTADANSGKLHLNITSIGEQVSDRDMYSTNTYFDNTWHHVVVAINTTSVKWYIDGQLEATKTLTTGTLNIDSLSSSPNTYRLIGASRSSVSGNIGTTTYKGWLDEFAIYGFELSTQQVLDNFNAGASVNFATGVLGTASALSVMPTNSADGIHNAAPMTASALFVETQPSNFDYVDGIQKIISDCGPETWFKFDYVTDYSSLTPVYITNYGSGGSITYTGGSYPDVNQIGPAQEPSIQLEIGSTSNYITSTSSALFTTEISDSNFSIGIWFKVPTGIDTSEKQIFAYNGPTNSPLSLKINNKKLVYSIQTSHTTYSHTTTTDISEDVWHLAVLKLDLAATTIKYYLDGTEVYSETAVQGNRATPTTWSLGKSSGNGTDTGAKRLILAHYFVDTYNDVTPTVITNLYNAGTRQNQAKGVMRQPILKFLNKYDDTVQALNPLIQLGLNETTGTIVENVGSSTGGTFTLQGSNYTRGTSVLTKNRYGYNFTNKNTYIAGNYATATNSFSDNTKTVSVYAKINTVTGSDLQIIHFDGGSGGIYGIGLSLLANANGPQLTIIATANPATWGTISAGTSYFGDWHLYTMVRDGSNVKFYVDGKQVGNTLTYSSYNLSDSGFTATGGGETVWFGQSAATVNKYVDEVAVFDYALSAQQIFEMWQAIEIDKATSSSEFVMPTNIAGTGNAQTASPMEASAEIVMPDQTDEIQLLPDHLEAFAEFLHPNYGGNVVIDANYGHTAFEASALFHDPQFQIGDFHSAASMDASALMVHPISIAAGAITVSSMIALDVTLVMPGIVTIKGAQHFAEPMRSNAIFPLPPAYVQLTDDDWYVNLLAGHAERVIEPVQAQLSNLPNQSTTDVVQGGFLSFFEDVISDRTATTATNFITNEIPAYYYDRADAYSYDENGDLIELDTTKSVARITNARSSTDPSPILGSGYFDPYERKAVRVNNVEIPFPGTGIYYSQRPYNIEFSFKSTKQDQIIAYGKWNSFNGYARNIGVVGLFNGKIYLAEDAYKVFSPDPVVGLNDFRANIPATAPHPKNFVNRAQYLLGRKNIADGQWHHIIIQQGWTDGRTQIWVDGELDRQIGVTAETGGGYSSFPGSDGTNTIRPYIIGFNTDDDLLYSDFETSGWNFYPARFITQDKILANFAAYSKWKPIKAEPMTATIRMTDNNAGKGNRPRALLLYWWESTSGQGTHDNGKYGYWDEETFPLSTTDTKDQPPQQYYGWDIFPIDIIGRNTSDMIKENVWTGNGYRDSVTGSPRYLDLMSDIDITKFDAIFFKNYPEQTEELDEYIREEISDTYFGIKENVLYDNFLKSLRAAVDSGLSLYVTNAKLALDLGIIDRVEQIPDLSEGDFEATDTFVQNRFANNQSALAYTSGTYADTWRNNRLRIVNTFEDITNYPTYLWRDWMLFTNDDALNYGGVNRPYISLLDRPNGLQVGDEFIISDAYTYGLEYEAVPFANVKAGTIITAFANTIDRNGVAIDNPYKNYATCIAVSPGTILNGKATGGKIFVNFTERINGTVSQITGSIGRERPHWKSRDTHLVELIQDKWINQAYADGSITLEKKNELLASGANLDRKLEAAIAAGNQTQINIINGQKYWDFNGLNIISNKAIINDPTGGGVEKDGLADGVRKTIVNKTSRKGIVSTRSVSTTQQWFSITWAYLNPTIQIKVPSILSNGFSWLADKIVDEGTVLRVAPMTAIAVEIPQATAVGDKDKTVYAQPAFANARIIDGTGYTPNEVSISTLPLFAEANFGEFVKSIKPDVFTATAAFRQNVRTLGIQEDEIVVYINHVDPILYLREEVIK